MAADQSGVRWPAWPVAGAVGAGRRDDLPDVSAGFSLTPSGQAEQENAAQIRELFDVPAELVEEGCADAGSEFAGQGLAGDGLQHARGEHGQRASAVLASGQRE